MQENNPLEIKEPHLLAHHLELDELFALNELEYEAEYYFEPNPKMNATVSYFVNINGRLRSGFILNKGKKINFKGAIFKDETVRHMEIEGFSRKQIEDEGPIFASAPSVEAFFCMLCFPIINDLILLD